MFSQEEAEEDNEDADGTRDETDAEEEDEDPDRDPEDTDAMEDESTKDALELGVDARRISKE